ncbi:MAG: hypothetical protein HQL69_22320 [Magnetococcales bacterium]|nr:hypothetical protein [Magnetococcales bacterium]
MAIKSAIKPIEWVLDAVSCIIDKVLKPVIDAILKATGLDYLVKKLENALMEKLGINDVIEKIEAHFHLDDILHNTGVLDPDTSGSASVTMSNGWTNLSSSLGQYYTQKNDTARVAIGGLYTAITGSPLDPNKPAVIPHWPKPPKLKHPDEQEGQTNRGRLLLAAPSAHPRRRKPFDALDKILTVTQKPHLLKAHRTPPPLRLGNPFTLHAERWQHVDTLDETIDKACDRLNGLTDKVHLVSENLKQLDASLSIPTTFHAQIVDLKIFLTGGRDFLLFLGNIEIFQDVLPPVAGVIQTQVTACEDVDRDAPLLQKAVDAIETSIGPALTHIPTTLTISQSCTKMQGWKQGALTLAKTIDIGHEMATEASHTEELNGYSNTVNDRFKAVSDIARDIYTTADGISNSLDALNEALVLYANTLTPISEHDQLISDEALPTADKAARILSTIDSIFDPLAELLIRTQCVDGNTPIKVGANFAMDTIKNVAESGKDSWLNRVIQLLQALADKGLPLGQLHEDMNKASETLSTNVVADITSAASDLATQMDKLNALLKESMTFTFKDAKDKEHTVENQFIQGDMTNPRALAKAIGGA